MQPILRTVIFCDDIRREEGNKLSLMGIYTKYFFLLGKVKLPLLLPRLCIYQRWEGLKAHNRIYIQVTRNGEALSQFSKPFEVGVGEIQDPSDFRQINISISPFKVEAYGEYHFKTSVGTSENVIDDSILTIMPAPE